MNGWLHTGKERARPLPVFRGGTQIHLLGRSAAGSSLCIHEEGIDGGAAAHEEAVALAAAEAEVGAAFGKIDPADELACRIEDGDPVEPFGPHPPADPEV